MKIQDWLRQWEAATLDPGHKKIQAEAADHIDKLEHSIKALEEQLHGKSAGVLTDPLEIQAEIDKEDYQREYEHRGEE